MVAIENLVALMGKHKSLARDMYVFPHTSLMVVIERLHFYKVRKIRLIRLPFMGNIITGECHTLH